MASSDTSSRYLSVASGHIDSLINYVLDVKPYHTKLSEIVEEFLFEDHINVKVQERHEQLVVLGPDYLNKSANSSLRVWDMIGAARPADVLSAERQIISDGTRLTFPIPLTVIPKLLSASSQDTLTVGVNDDQQIVGLPRGVFSPRRFDGVGIPRVLKDNEALTESVDYHISHGAFSFNTMSGQRWKELNVAQLSQFAPYPGSLAFDNVYENFGSIINIEATAYEEFTLRWDGAALDVVGSASGHIGFAQPNSTFLSAQLTFTFAEAYGDAVGTPPYLTAGDTFYLTPRAKISVAVDAPIETWTLIKTNPQALTAKPIFARTSSVTLASTPSISIYTQSLEWTPTSTWLINFTSATTYSISAHDSNAPLAGYPKTVDLVNGCSYKDDLIQFTIVPPLNGFQPNDKFLFNVGEKANYLVYGSVSGWQAPATIGEWYWNGKIGFKVPKLDYFAVRRSATISITNDLDVWTPVVVNSQELTNISYVNNSFIASGARQIAAQSTDGLEWSDDLTNFATVDNRLLIVGEDGLVAETEDGENWRRVNTNTRKRLRDIDIIPTDTALEAATSNLIVVVGNDGTILTSLNGLGWVRRGSGTNYTLNSVTHNQDWIIVVGDNGTILRSQDRINWIPCNSPTTEVLHRVKFLNGAFFAVGTNGTILKSVNGITWQSLYSNTTAQLNDIAYGLNTLVAVGLGGVICKSTDGLFWTATAGKPINAIEFGPEEQVFVAVEHKVSEVANFQPLRMPHSVAVPSVYSIVFRSPVNGTDVVGGTVKNNVYGFKPGFKVDREWSDEFTSFKIGPSSDVYRNGEQIDVYLVPKASYVAMGDYDDLPYDSAPYEAHVGKIEYPLDLLDEYFPLYHSAGCVIIPSITEADDGKTVTIDKAMMESVDFRIGKVDDQILPPSELAAINRWIPLEYRYSDRRIANDSIAEFPDLATYIDAYLSADPDTKVFTIMQPRFKTTARPATASLTFDPTFFAKYLPERKYFSLRFNQADSYEQHIRVKVSENLRVYARVRLNFDEIAYVNVSDMTPRQWETVAILRNAEDISVKLTEGGLFSRVGYSALPYDVVGYDVSFIPTPLVGVKEVTPGNFTYTGDPNDYAMVSTAVDEPAITVKDKSVEAAGTSFAEGLQIAVKHSAAASTGYDTAGYDTQPYDMDQDTIPIGTVISLHLHYDVASQDAVYVTTIAEEYLVTHGFLGRTPTVIIQPDVGGAFTVEPEMVYTPVAGAAMSSFRFHVAPGTGPFRLTLS